MHEGTEPAAAGLVGQALGLRQRDGPGVGEASAYWRGHRVVLLDRTCVSMPDEPALFEAFRVQTGYHGPGRYPLARVATLCLAGTRTVIAYALGGYRSLGHLGSGQSPPRGPDAHQLRPCGPSHPDLLAGLGVPAGPAVAAGLSSHDIRNSASPCS